MNTICILSPHTTIHTLMQNVKERTLLIGIGIGIGIGMGTSTGNTIRKSIFHFLKNYQHLTSTPTLLAFPYAASYLVSSSYIFPSFHTRLISSSLSSPQLDQLNLLKLLSQTTLTSLLNLVSPFAFTFLLLSRASVIRRTPSTFLCLFNPLLTTQLCSTLLMLAANATCFLFSALCFGFLEVLGLSSSRGHLLFSGAVICSILVANAACFFICNLALVSSGMGNRAGGFIPILKACVMIKDRTAAALSLAVAMNTAFAAVEALFRYRVVRAYYRRDLDRYPCIPGLLVIMEGIFIAFLYAVFLVFDTVVGCTFWENCTHEDEDLLTKSKTEMPILDIIP